MLLDGAARCEVDFSKDDVPELNDSFSGSLPFVATGQGSGKVGA